MKYFNDVWYGHHVIRGHQETDIHPMQLDLSSLQQTMITLLPATTHLWPAFSIWPPCKQAVFP
jgi:hypothetical protein